MSGLWDYSKTSQSTWDTRWMRIAREVASWSKDPQKKIGAVAVRHQREIAKGYNGFPAKIPDYRDMLQDSDTRRRFMVHAEENMINNAMKTGQTLEESTVYLYGLAPCQKCTIVLINAGISRLVVCRTYIDPKWDEDWVLAENVLHKTDIVVQFMLHEDL